MIKDDEKLNRFLQAQEQQYVIALYELANGQKTTHWIWFIFPQLTDLGHSETAKFYGLNDKYEATDYLNHPYLGSRYYECCHALMSHADKSAETIMGSEVDAQKLQSSLTLMQIAGADDIVEQCLMTFYNGNHCISTKQLLEA